MTENRERLDQPREERRGLRRPRIDADAFGSAAERMARYFGTARYLVIQTLFVIVWIAINAVWAVDYKNSHHNGTKPFDPYPFILLNLAFSTQAAYAAPLILLAQNRQADRDKVQAKADRDEAQQSKADLDYLAREIAAIRMALGEVATRDFLRSELARADERKDGKDPKRKKKTAEGDDLAAGPTDSAGAAGSGGAPGSPGPDGSSPSSKSK